MKHWDIRPRVISSVFALRTFTVPSLCQDSGLDRKQVYPILEKLTSSGFLHVDDLKNEKRKAHRPLQIYDLTTDPSRKKALFEQLLPLLRLSEAAEKELESESLIAARKLLNQIEADFKELHRGVDDRFSYHFNILRIGEARQKLKSLGSTLELALVEAGVTEEEPPAAIETEIRRFEGAKKQLEELELRVGVFQRRLDAEKEASVTLREIAAYTAAAAGEPAIKALSSAVESCSQDWDLEWVGDLADRAKRYRAKYKTEDLWKIESGLLEDRYKRAQNPEFKSILSAIDADLTSACRYAKSADQHVGIRVLFWALTKLAFRYAGDAETTLIASRLLEKATGVDPDIVSYNTANLWLLAGGTEQALQRWRDQVENYGLRLFQSKLQPVYPVVLLTITPATRLNQQLMEEVERVLGVSLSLSIVSPVPLRIVSANPYIIEPTLFNPIETSERVRVSESLRIHAPDLYVYGPIEDLVSRPGLPQLALATGLVRLGVPKDDAWEFADNIGPGNALIVVNSNQELGHGMFQRLRDFLGVFFPVAQGSANSPALIPASAKHTAELAKKGTPVVYDLGTEGKLRKAFTVDKTFATSE